MQNLQNFNLNDMTISELKALSQQIRLELTKRLEETQEARHEVMTSNDIYEFDFDATLRRSVPFVARCYWIKNKGMERDFKSLVKQGNAAAGKYTAAEGEILDINSNDGRGYHIVHQGELKLICAYNDDHKIVMIKLYLKGQIDRQAFLEMMGIVEISNDILDDLREDD